MLASENVKYVILGHSERRSAGEKSDIVAKKATAAIAARIQPIICIGEESRDHSGVYLKHIKHQIIESLSGIPKTKLKDIIIAYEPIWAIGGDEAMSSHEMHQMMLYIKKVVTEKYTRTIANSIQILYGGSVTAHNACDMIENGVVDGLLVGRASLNPEEFIAIAKNISYAKRNF
jgi:triosephosphate isomerase